MKYVMVVLILVVAALVAAGYVRGGGRDDAPQPAGDPSEDWVEEGELPPGELPPEEVPAPAEPTQAREIARRGGVYAPDDAVVRTVAKILTQLIQGDASEKDRDDLAQRLAEVLELEQLGPTTTIESAARSTIDTMLAEARKAQAAGAPAGGNVTEFQSMVVKALSEKIGSALRRTFVTGGDHQGNLISLSIDVELPDGYEKASWAVLGGFEYKEGMKLPEVVTALNGKKVGIAGYMMSLGEFEDIHEFLLVESMWSCCFGVPPDVHQVVVVRIPDDEEGLELVTVPVLVLGKIDIGEVLEDGWVTSVYRITAEIVEIVE